ncbi:MAG: glycosyltransferase [Xanthomonadales bacterium]|nr:glycosyltransferase [Xanthomonadales bacterium]
MAPSALVFWSCIGLVGWTYAGYPAWAAQRARRRGSTPASGTATPPLTVVIAAHGEARRIEARIRDVLAQDYPPERLEVLVVDDGSEDGTSMHAGGIDPRVRVLTLPGQVGKAAALNAAIAAGTRDIIAFTDARQRYAPGALRALVAAFADPAVGAVSGELVIDDGEVVAIGLYWRIEKALRAAEARLGWLHGVSGANHAMRRNLYAAMPKGLVLDDLWLPLHVRFAGRRVWMVRGAIAYDQASASTGEEFHRKLRTLAGNWQLLAHLPRLANPRRNPVFAAWFSHKFLRLVAPWALLLALLASARLAGRPFYRLAFLLQVVAWLAAAFALARPRAAQRVPLLPAAGTFLALNAAALLALPALLLGPRRLWRRH